MPLCSVQEAIEEIKQGNMVIVVDDEDRENEGDLTIAAEFATPEAINFMATHGRGLICLPMAEELIDKLELPMMTENNKSGFETPFTVSIEARQGVTTGISAQDRSTTIHAAIKDGANSNDIVCPGHVFPLRANPNGVLGRIGQTEGGVDLARLAGLKPAAVICEIMRDDGEMARMPDLIEFAKLHGMKIVTIADMIQYRLKYGEMLLEETSATDIETEYGGFRLVSYKSKDGGTDFLALVRGEFSEEEPVMVRVHKQCTSSDVFGSTTCDCGQLLKGAMKMIADAGKGVIVYLRNDTSDLSSCERSQQGRACTYGVNVDSKNVRNYGLGAQILRDLGARKMRLISNNPKKLVGLEGFGLEIVEQIPVETHC